MKKLLAALSALFFIAGCGGSALLPKSELTTVSPWGSFEEAKASFDRIEPNKTTLTGLKDLGFDPFSVPNVKILSYLEITNRFLANNPSLSMEDLHKDVRKCLREMDRCHGLDIMPENIKQERYGNFLVDLLQFRRNTRETGWRFNAFLVLLDDTVVYKLWAGEPSVNRGEVRKKPLGLLQELDSLLMREAGL